MLRHVVLFKFAAGTSDEQIAGLEEGLAVLPEVIPQIRGYVFGRDLGLADGNYDFALVADFDDADGWRAYSADETHLRMIAERVRPIVDSVVRVQHEV